MRRELLKSEARSCAFACAIGLAGLATSGPAWAHGSAPSAIEILSSDDGRVPTFVALSYGLAKRESSGAFSFVCPAAWGSADAVLAARGGLLAAVSEGRLFVGEGTCALSPIAREEAMFDVVATPRSLVALGRVAGKVRVLEVSSVGIGVRAEADETGPDACVLDAIAGTEDGGLVGACSSPRPSLFLPDETPRIRPFVLPFAVSRLVPRVVTDRTISLLALANKGSFLVDLDRPDAATAPRVAGPFATVLGPALVGTTIVAIVDGHLWEQRVGAWTMGAAVPYTCLSRAGEATFACSLGSTVRLEERGGVIVEAEAVFSLAMVGEPTSACGAASGDAGGCRGEWSHFGAEAGLLETEPAISPDGPRSPRAGDASAPMSNHGDGGCAIAPGSARTAAWIVGIVAGAFASFARRMSRLRCARRIQ